MPHLRISGRLARATLTFVLCVPVSIGAGQTSQLPPDAAPDALLTPLPRAVVTRDATGGVTIRASRLTGPITIDGRLEEDVYRTVASVSDLVQQEPRAGDPATEKTEIWFFVDGKNLYISGRCWDSQPENDVLGEMRRDGESFTNQESFTVTLDTYLDRRNGFMFGVNPLGGFLDSYVTNERDNNRDWNTVWEARVGQFEGGWTVEMAIPFKSLRYQPGGRVWGVQVRRVVRWKNEISYLTAIPPSRGAGGMFAFSSAATLVGVDPPPTSLNLEIKPYLISGIRSDRAAAPPTVRDVDGDAGLDIKYGLTRSLTTDFTYNTDFAQVEDDAQQINLTRFSLFFPEKREFFSRARGFSGSEASVAGAARFRATRRSSSSVAASG